MKKILLLVALVVAMVSCTTEEYYTSTEIFEKVYTVNSSDWELYDGKDGVYYFYEFSERVLDPNMYRNGYFAGYIVKVLNNVESLTPLPYDVYSMDGTYRWTEQYSCEFSQNGYVTFIVKYNDFDMGVKPYTVDFVVKYCVNNN